MLGVEYSQAQQILAKFSNDYAQALSDVLHSWVDAKMRSKAELKVALEGAELGGVYARTKQILYRFNKDYAQALSSVLHTWVDAKERSKADLKVALEGAQLGGVYRNVDEGVRWIETNQGASQPATTGRKRAGKGEDNTGTTGSARLAVESPDNNVAVPLEILARGPRALKAYAKTAARDKTRKVYHTRLMLVGQERVGKTSLRKALLGQEFNTDEKVTDGVETRSGCKISIDLAKAGEKWNINQTDKATRIKPSGDSYWQVMMDDCVEHHRTGLQETNQPDSEGNDKTDVIGLNPSEGCPQMTNGSGG
ncbi:uncharacterized protein [Diadema antillarum]|uniref:uncharacterized protein n=1 Tax=Diadema antillarum TaxID=105358 RepID=UPI003A84DA0D